MSRVVKIGAAGVIGFMTATSAFALTTAEAMDEFDLLAISEAPLTETELGEARGGFSFGGFDFKFGVEIAPVSVDVPAASSMFGDGGLFGDDGVFGNDGGPIGQDGVFGESGIFGQNNVPGNRGQTPAADSTPFESTAQAAGFENTMVVEQPASSTAPAVQQIVDQPVAIVADNSGAASNVAPVVAPIIVAPAVQGPAEVVADAVADAIPQVAVAQAADEIVDAAIAPDMTPATVVQASVTPVQQAATSTAPKQETVVAQTNAAPQPRAETVPVQRAVTQRITQTATMSGRTFVVDNTINGAKFTQTIELNVAIPNFDSRISRAIADAAVATIASTNYILGQIN